MSDVEAILRWYAAYTFICAALLPLVAYVGAPLGTSRYGLVRPLGLVGLTLAVWWPAALTPLPFSRPVLAIAALLLAGAGWGLWVWRGLDGFDWRALALYELLWLVTFLGYARFRGFYPDIINTEKPMEIALLTSISRWDAVPAPDPWLAGSSINYYYFGYQSFATLIKLSNVPASIGFNLALASIIASCATAAAAAVSWLARSAGLRVPAVLGTAVLAVVLLLASGNLETARRLLDDREATIDAGWWDGVGWNASRVVIDHGVNEPDDVRPTINEFPAFSFVLGDLHPHVLTYPLLAAVITLAFGLAAGPAPPARLMLVGAAAGLLYASNSWDAPLGLLVIGAALAIRHGPEWRRWARDIGLAAAGALLAALPFLIQFDAPVGVSNGTLPGWLAEIPIAGRLFSTFGIVTWRPSSVRELLIVHGAWLAFFALFAATVLLRDRRLVPAVHQRPHATLVVALLLFGLGVAWAPAVILLGLPVALATWIAVRATERSARLVVALFAIGFGLALVPEFIYIQDVFNDRMNTVFKLYFQSWMLLALASASGVALAARAAGGSARGLVIGAALVVTALTLPYTPLSASDWTGGYATYQGLDGAEYVERWSPEEQAVIEWVSAHARSGDALVEVPGCSYINAFGVPMNRVSAFSGVPAVIGWIGHEGQWRRGQSESIYAELDAIARRANDILNGIVPAEQSGVRFVIVGRQELQGTADCGSATPREGAAEALRQAGWELAFEAGETSIYARPGDPAAAGLR